MSGTGRPIPERVGVTPDIFQHEILPAAQPAVFRGLVHDWPIVQAGRQSPQAVRDYLRRFDRGNPVHAMYAPASTKGRFFYNEDLSGFNFQRGSASLSSAFDYLIANLNEDPPPAIAIQSVQVRANAPGFEAEHPMPLLQDIEPRLWIGNAGIVAAHHDPSENIACATAGRRRFTLFPPAQIGNLYMGPFELTPAGATISLVDFENPDFERFPRYTDALEASFFADLEPGDAVYIPYLWWHHVRSFERFNMLVNYWWAPPANGRGIPRDVLYHAMVAIKDMPPAHREAWRAMFEHYVFHAKGDPGEHLPADRRGIVGELDDKQIRELRNALARNLMRTKDL